MDRELAAACLLTEHERTQCSLRSALKKTRKLGITGWREHSAVHALVFETIRRKNAIDRCLYFCLPKGVPPPKNHFIKNLLRVAIYRVVFEGHPLPLVHNTVLNILKSLFSTNETVNESCRNENNNNSNQLAECLSGSNLKRDDVEIAVTSHVLNKLTPDIFSDVLRSILDPVERLAVQHFHPTWLTRDLISFFGEHFSIKLLESNNKPLPRFIRLNLLRDVDETLALLQEEGVQLQQDSHLPEMYKVVSTEKPIPRLSSYKTGRYYLQDRGSAIVANVVAPKPGDVVIDACAAPGGKTTHMAMLMKDEGQIIAIDKHPRRLEELKRNVQEQEFSIVDVWSHDLLQPLKEDLISADKILVDAPCSGLGTIPQVPEVKWRNTRQKLKKLAHIQLKILENISVLLKVGGILVYATCSIHPIENEGVIQTFLERHSEFELEYQDPFIGLESPFMGNVQRLYPHINDTEGFTIFKMRKKS